MYFGDVLPLDEKINELNASVHLMKPDNFVDQIHLTRLLQRDPLEYSDMTAIVNSVIETIGG